MRACRPDELFGLWAVEPTTFPGLVDAYRSVDLTQLKAAAASTSSAPPAPPYRAVDGVAVFQWGGTFVKHPTSFGVFFQETSTVAARQGLREALRDPKIHSALVIVDSPGGYLRGLPALAKDVRAFAERKPLTAFVDDLAASAAYWAISGASAILTTAAAGVGCIGVFAVVEDTSGAMEQQGVKVHVVSSAPPLKGAGAPGAPLLPEHLAEFTRSIREAGGLFVSDVALGRGVPRAHADAWHTGQTWLGRDAQQRGLVDAIVNDEADALEDARQRGQVAGSGRSSVAGARVPGPAAADRTAPARVVSSDTTTTTTPAPPPTAAAALEQLAALARSLKGTGPGLDSEYSCLSEACRRRPDLVAAEKTEREARWALPVPTPPAVASPNETPAFGQLRALARAMIGTGPGLDSEPACFAEACRLRPDLVAAEKTQREARWA